MHGAIPDRRDRRAGRPAASELATTRPAAAR